MGTQIPRDSLGPVDKICFPFRGQLRQQGTWELGIREVNIGVLLEAGPSVLGGAESLEMGRLSPQTRSCQEHPGLFPSLKSRPG